MRSSFIAKTVIAKTALVAALLATGCAVQSKKKDDAAATPEAKIANTTFPDNKNPLQPDPTTGQPPAPPANSQAQDITPLFQAEYLGYITKTFYNGQQAQQTYSITLKPAQYKASNGQYVTILTMDFKSPAQAQDPVTIGSIAFPGYLAFYSQYSEYYWFRSSIIQRIQAPNFQDYPFSIAFLFDLPSTAQVPTQLWLYVQSCGLYQGVSCDSTAQDVQLSNAMIRR